MYPQPVFEVYPQNGISHPIVAFTHRDYLSLNNKIISIDRKLPDDVVKIHPTFTDLCYKLRPMLTDPAAFFTGKESLEDPQDMWGNSLITQIGRVLSYLLEREETAPFVKTVKIFVPFHMVGSVEHLPELSNFPHTVHKPAMTYGVCNGLNRWPMRQYWPQTFGGGMFNADLQKAWKEEPFNINPPAWGAKVTNQVGDTGCTVPVHPKNSNEQKLGTGFRDLQNAFYQGHEGAIVQTHLPTGGEAVEEKEVELHEVADIIHQTGMVDEWKIRDGFIMTNCFGGYHMKLINENAEHFIVKIPFGYPIVGKPRQIFVFDQILFNENAELFRDLVPGQTHIRQGFRRDKDIGKLSDSEFELFVSGMNTSYMPVENRMNTTRFNHGVNGFSYSTQLVIFSSEESEVGTPTSDELSVGVSMFTMEGLTFSHHPAIENMSLLIPDGGGQSKFKIQRRDGMEFKILTDNIHAVYKSPNRSGWVIVRGEEPSFEHTSLNEMLALLNVKTAGISKSYHFPFKQSK